MIRRAAGIVAIVGAVVGVGLIALAVITTSEDGIADGVAGITLLIWAAVLFTIVNAGRR